MTVEYCMARGFESKDVEFQQAEAERMRVLRPPIAPAERERDAQRQTIGLALTRSRRERELARTDAHRRMLDAAIADLERQLATLDSQG